MAGNNGTRPPPGAAQDEGQRRLAVLIDADNAQASVIDGLLAEVAKFGIASVKRIYGDFTSTRLQQWKAVLLEHSIQPVQQFAYTSGKNATDSSLIIDAMDLMYTRRFDGFCLVSSDSDFTRLAQRLREEGLMVYGFGEQKTPDAFRQACDKFIYTEVLRPSGGALSAPAQSTPTGPARKAAARKGPAATAKSRDGADARAGAKSRGGANARDAAQAAATAPAATTTAATRTASTTAVSAIAAASAAPPATADTERPGAATLPLRLLRQAIDQGSDDTGWANLAGVGHYVNKVRPDFDPRLYGCKKLSDLFRAHPRQFQVEERQVGPARALFVRTVE